MGAQAAELHGAGVIGCRVGCQGVSGAHKAFGPPGSSLFSACGHGITA